MAEIRRTRDHDPYGDIEFCVEWEDNHGIARKRYFRSRRAAGRFAVKIESDLLIETVESFKEAVAGMSPDEIRAFKERLNSDHR